MFVGHSLVAFALGALAATRLGADRDRALQLGVYAGAFALVPDLDIVYAPVGLALQSVQTIDPDAFWNTANVIHRGPTHSLLFGGVLATGVAFLATDRRLGHVVGAGVIAGLIAVAGMAGGSAVAGITTVYAVGGAAVATAARMRGVPASAVFAVASIGLLSHPFGDLVTGSPPLFFYPFGAMPVSQRITLHPDPTLHLLGAFLIEIGTVWLGIWTFTRLHDVSVRRFVHPRAGLGMGYAGAVFVIPPPTLHNAAVFVFSILALSGIWVAVSSRSLTRPVDTLGVVVTGTATVTVAAVGYGVAYVLF
ncbi:metal-dependent hydrolase [Halorubrum sp. HHNYT27]|uniref:metal-dependent hydrolase n=1 Tax=Halorubrum sp. HHNYT27 TaxID=3402275 RepID=UPI003EB88B90